MCRIRLCCVITFIVMIVLSTVFAITAWVHFRECSVAAIVCTTVIYCFTMAYCSIVFIFCIRTEVARERNQQERNNENAIIEAMQRAYETIFLR